jgi:iron complex outermembrane recepter protein
MKLTIALMMGALCVPMIAYPQQGEQDSLYHLSPVIITATQAKERETPATFSNLSNRQIRESFTMQQLPMLVSDLPSITSYSENGSAMGYTYINLRGFDQRRLSIMVNGVPQNDPEDHQVYWIDMPDLLAFTNTIQVQRGAGSAFYGPPAIGGSINITTTPVTSEPRISLSSGFGFQEFGNENTTKLNDRRYAMSFSSGLIEKQYMFYGNFSRTTSEGYRENSWVDYDGYFVGVARFDASMTTRLHIYGGPITDALSFVGLPKFVAQDKELRRANWSDWNPDPGWVGYSSHASQVISSDRADTEYVVPRQRAENENFTQPHYELIHEWKLSPSSTLSNTLFYLEGDGYFDYEADWIPYSSVDWFRRHVGYDSTFGVTSFPSFLIRGYVGNKQWGWLPRLEIDHHSGTLSLGGELRIHRSIHWGSIASASALPSSSFDPDFHIYEYNGEKDIVSGYVHEMYKLDDATTVMADLQLAYDRYGIRNEKFLHNDVDISYLFLNPRLGVNKNFSDQWNAYVSASYTSREPVLRNLYAAEDAYFGGTPQFQSVATSSGVQYHYDKPFIQPEHLFDFELGGNYASDRGRMSASVYWMQFQDELVKSGQIDIFGESVLMNAQRTRHIGVELSAGYRLTDAFEVSGNGTFSANRIVSHSFYDSTAGVYRVLDGNPIAGFPDVLGNLRLRYGSENRFCSVVLKYVGSFYTDNLKNEENNVPSYFVTDIDVTWQLPPLIGHTQIQLAGMVRNLFDRLYLASGEGSAFFPAAERNYYLGLTVNL